MKAWSYAFTTVTTAAILSSAAFAQSSLPGELKVGDAAPDFTIKDVEGKQSVSLSALQGKPVVLLFGSCT